VVDDAFLHLLHRDCGGQLLLGETEGSEGVCSQIKIEFVFVFGEFDVIICRNVIEFSILMIFISTGSVVLGNTVLVAI
jgi:hypothetical protein